MWRRFVDETIRGAGMDYLAAKGNHDADGWDGVQWLWNGDPDGYAAQLRPTLPAGADCRGEYGTAMVCDYRGVTLVLSDVGVDVAGESANARQYEHIDRALRESSNPWKVCVWHMNMEDMQVSYKGDSVGWGAFEICRRRGAFVVNGHAHSYARSKEMARYGRKVYGHTKKELVVSHPGIDRVYLSSGENGTNGVAVVGFGGYKNEPQLRGGDHWAKIYSSECLPGDDACERAPEARKFGALMCDFSDAQPGAEAECWTVTTVEKDASRAEKRRAYRNPADRFFLVAGPRSERAEVYLNAAEPRTRRAFDGDITRADPDCVDVQPPRYDCARQREWGKCDSWFMINGGYCEKTCGRCVALFPGGSGITTTTSTRTRPNRTRSGTIPWTPSISKRSRVTSCVRSEGSSRGGKGVGSRRRANASGRTPRAAKRAQSDDVARVDANRVNDTFYESATSTDICASRASRGCSRVDRTFSSPDT